MENNKIIILIPSYNELPTLKIICNKLLKLKYDFLVLDDCSTDKTDYWLESKKINFIKNKNNLGYEINLIDGFKHIIEKTKYTHIITFDGDGEHKIKDLIKVIKLIKKWQFDLLICNREKKNRWSERIVSLLFKLKYDLEDPLSGFKVYKVNKLKKILKNIGKNYFLTDCIFYFKKKKYKVFNYDIDTIKRVNSRIGNNFLTNLKILKCALLCIK